jgi:hypothetical protein
MSEIQLKEQPDTKERPNTDTKMRAAIDYLERFYFDIVSVLNKHNSDDPQKIFNIQVNISASPKLQDAIQHIADGYHDTMLKKARIKLDMVALYQQKPWKVKRLWSAEAKSRHDSVRGAMEQLEHKFVEVQCQLMEQNTNNFKILCDLVEVSYDDATRVRLGNRVKLEAATDAHRILGKVIEFTVEKFNDAFMRFGVEEFGVPNNIENPRRLSK